MLYIQLKLFFLLMIWSVVGFYFFTVKVRPNPVTTPNKTVAIATISNTSIILTPFNACFLVYTKDIFQS